MNDTETIRIMALLLIIAPPACFLAGYIFGHRDRARWYLQRMEDHLRQWNDFCAKAMHETDGLK